MDKSDGFIKLLFTLGVITHIWTVFIAIAEGGVIGGILTFVFPVLSEIYWMFSMFGVNDVYSYLVLSQLVIPIIYVVVGGGIEKNSSGRKEFF